MMLSFFRRSFIASYRIAAVFSLYGLLAGIVAYAAVMAFYSLNKSWVAPVLISPSNDRILALTAQIVTSQQTLDGLALNTKNLREARAEMIQHRAILRDLDEQLTNAARREKANNLASGTELTRLAVQKDADVRSTQEMLEEIDRSESDVDRNLKAGLVTRSEALAQRTTLAQFRNAYTDARVSDLVLKDNARQKLTTDLSAVDTMSKAVELRSELSQLELNIKSGDYQIANNAVQIENIKKAIRTTQDNPYFVAAQSSAPVEMAFLPFDNQGAVTVESPVYDCALSFVWCAKVGTVARVFTEEERATNPVFKTDLRGTFIQLALTEHEAVKSKTLFIGRKPLLF
jgi:hypothetical protein